MRFLKRGLPSSYRQKRPWGGDFRSSRAKSEKPEADKGQDHRYAAARANEQRQDRRRRRDPEARRENDAGRINRVIDREPGRSDQTVADEGAHDRRARTAEGDRPVEQEIDDRRNNEARRPGQLRRQTEIFRAEVGDRRIDEIADDADDGEGGNLPRRARLAMDRGGFPGDGHLAQTSAWVAS